MNNNDPNPENRPPKLNFNNNRFALFFLISIVGLFIIFFFISNGGGHREISYSEFFSYLKAGDVEQVTVFDNGELEVVIKGFSGNMAVYRSRIPFPYEDPELLPLLREQNIIVKGEPKSISGWAILIQFIPWILITAFIWFMFRQVQGGGNRAFSFGKICYLLWQESLVMKNKQKLSMQKKPRVLLK